MIYIYIFNRSWVDTRWQQYITHLHTMSPNDWQVMPETCRDFERQSSDNVSEVCVKLGCLLRNYVTMIRGQ
jgi:hypothetical protein